MSSGNEENNASSSKRSLAKQPAAGTGNNNNNYNADQGQKMDVDITDMVRNYRNEQDELLIKNEKSELPKPQVSGEKRCA